jgi:hypothetical protein
MFYAVDRLKSFATDESLGIRMIVIDEYKQALNSIMHPSAATSRQMSIGNALLFYYKATLIPMVLTAIEFALAGSALGGLVGSLVKTLPFAGGLLGAGFGVLVVLYWIIFIPIGLFVWAAVLHLFGKILLRWFKGNYSNTFTGMVYAQAAQWSLVWVPVIGWIIGALAGLVTSLVGVANQNKTEWWRVLVAAIIAGIVVYIIELIVIAATVLG